MAYRIALLSMTLSDLQGQLPIASLFKYHSSYSCAAVVKNSVDTTRGVVPLQ